MKKFTLSVVAVLAMGTFAVAGGDIAPVEPVIETPIVEEPSTGAFYVGAGYSYMNLDAGNGEEHNGDEVLLLAGYNFNPYIGVEARYGGLTDCLENTAVYMKPMYPFGATTVYGLLGYGKATYDNGVIDASEDGFQWGIGADYAVNEKVAVFVDYTNFYDDTGFDGSIQDVTVDSINVGITYTF